MKRTLRSIATTAVSGLRTKLGTTLHNASHATIRHMPTTPVMQSTLMPTINDSTTKQNNSAWNTTYFIFCLRVALRRVNTITNMWKYATWNLSPIIAFPSPATNNNASLINSTQTASQKITDSSTSILPRIFAYFTTKRNSIKPLKKTIEASSGFRAL